MFFKILEITLKVAERLRQGDLDLPKGRVNINWPMVDVTKN